MRIEFHYWPGNTEVLLIDDDVHEGFVADKFFTSARTMGVAGSPNGWLAAFDAKWFFELLEEVAPPPIIGGEFGHLHPYWAERKAKRMQREGITQQDIAETMPPKQGEL